MFGEFKKDLQDACWVGYKKVGMKKKGDKMVPNCVPEEMSIEDAQKVDGYIPESYEIGHDYANHTKDITPGEQPDVAPVDAKLRGTPSDPKSIGKKDVKEWASAESTIHKYRERYKEEWRAKLDEVVSKMIEKL
jgi:hypothetical protein